MPDLSPTSRSPAVARRFAEVLVVEVLSYKAADADPSKVVEELAEVIGRPVKIVGLVIEESEKDLLSAAAAVAEPASKRAAGDSLDGDVEPSSGAVGPTAALAASLPFERIEGSRGTVSPWSFTIAEE